MPETSFYWSMGLCNRIRWLPEILVVEGFSSEEQVFIYLIQLHSLPQLSDWTHAFHFLIALAVYAVRSTTGRNIFVKIFITGVNLE